MTPATEYLLNTSLTLAVVVLLAWLLVYASRRWERAAPRGPLELIGSLRLEGKRAVYLVRVGQRVVALAATEGAVVKIMELAEGELPGEAKQASFGGVLARLRGGARTEEPPGAGPHKGAGQSSRTAPGASAANPREGSAPLHRPSASDGRTSGEGDATQ